MKKCIAVFLVLLAAFSLATCGGPAPEQETGGNAGPSSGVQDSSQAGTGQTSQQEKGEESMQIKIEANGSAVVFQLNGSQAARALYEQLPLSVEVENFSNNEKIFYPPDRLDTSDAPLAQGGAGTLAYYAPWGDVVMFYGDFSPNGSLFELGQAVSGAEQISTLSGTITISVYQ